MYIEMARKYMKDFLDANPSYYEEVQGLFELMLSEIEEGSSEFHEYNNFVSSLKELINEG